MLLNKANIIFFGLILLIIFFLWRAPSNEGPAVPDDEDHKKVIVVGDCIACHKIEELIKANRDHPPKTECLLCHATS
jgi:hypothetical protein